MNRLARAALLAFACLLAVVPTAGAAEIAEGSLSWGVRESFRSYVTGGGTSPENVTVAGGATVDADGAYDFPVASGSYEAATRSTTISFAGSVHFTKYPEGAIHLLDLRISDPTLTITGDQQILTADVVSRETGSSPDLVDYGRIELASLDVSSATVTGSTDWSGIRAYLTAQGAPAFAGFYPEGAALDPIVFSYEGEGGAPSFEEAWTAPGTPVLSFGEPWYDPATGSSPFISFNSYNNIFPSADGEVVHLLTNDILVANKVQLTALATSTMQPLHTQSIPVQTDGWGDSRDYDPDSNAVFYTAEVAAGETEIRSLAWQAATNAYDEGLVAELDTTEAVDGKVGTVLWNPVSDELFVFRFQRPEGGTWNAYIERYAQSGGSWTKLGETDLPNDVLNPSWLKYYGGDHPNTVNVAPDGSILIARATGAADGEYAPIVHLTIAGDGTAQVEAVADSTVQNESGEDVKGYAGMALAGASPAVAYTKSPGGADLVRYLGLGGAPPAWEGPAVAPENARILNVARSEALTWITYTDSKKLLAFDGTEVRGAFDIPNLYTSTSAMLVSPEEDTVYVTVIDSSKKIGIEKIEINGYSPSFTGQPQDQTVTLSAGETDEQVTLSAAATGDPAPTLQWQAKAPGASKFSDLPGETGTQLNVEATREKNGTQYRAIASSSSGEFASHASTLEVRYTPRITADISNASVTAGSDAGFAVVGDGEPEPQITWQRRVDGFWQSIDTDDDNFRIEGGTLTVLFTNTEQSGSLFRARLENPVGKTYSQPARLTVEPRVSIPPEGLDAENVSLEWTGNEEMQKAPPAGDSNYFSAGASDGSEATYSAAQGNARVFQVAPGGAETLATYATRAAHVGSANEQLLRLYGGEGRVEADGSASVEWEGSFSVNFYGGLVPFTFLDPELEVDDTGAGTLTATMVGCESSQAEPGVCAPFAAEPGVTVATFSGVEVDPAGEVEIDPDYEGVEVEGAEDSPQERSAPGWGAWPQSFVDFQVQTGLASYWYSSASAFDPYKPPHPFLVDFAGEALPGEGQGDDGSPQDGGAPAPLAVPPPAATAPIATARMPLLGRIGGRRGARVRGNGAATVLRVSCRGPLDCVVRTRGRVIVKVAGKRYRARVLSPRRIAAGKRGKVGLRLPKAARRALAGKRAAARVWIGVRSGNRSATRMARVLLRGTRGGGVPTRRISRSVGESGWVAIGRVRCRAASPCELRTPKTVGARAAAAALRARVFAPQRLAAGKAGKLKLRLGRGALERLSDRTARLRVRTVLRSAKRTSVRVIVVRLRQRAGGGAGRAGRAGGAGGGTGGANEDSGPESAPISGEPSPPARPAGAVDVSDVEIGWHPRDSWLRYASSGVAPGDGIHITGGAVGTESTASACPDRPSSSDAELPYRIDFAPKASWFDPASGVAGIYGQGSVRFRWKAHTIDLTASDPEIEINGSASRAIFRFSGSEGTAYPNQRADLVSLDLTGQPTVSNGGKTYSYDLMRGTLTENGVGVFAGFYTPPDNDEFGCVSVEFTLP